MPDKENRADFIKINLSTGTRRGLMSASDALPTEQFEFVTIEGLLAYGEQLAQRTSSGRSVLPPSPPPFTDRRQRVEQAIPDIRTFVQGLPAGLPSAETYRTARQRLIAEACGGDPLVFYAAWNWLLARGELAPLYRAPIGATQKPAHRRPVAIVPRANLTPQLAEGRIVLDLGDDRFWLLPRDLADRTLFFYDAPRRIGSRKQNPQGRASARERAGQRTRRTPSGRRRSGPGKNGRRGRPTTWLPEAA